MSSPVPTCSVDFPFESKFVDVLGSKIHFIEQGEGDPILFLHAVPASNYSWRNIIPSISSYGRCIAPDLIGMGKSGKPDIAYRLFDHINYINEFIEKLNLDKITLVLHGWGSVIGFDYAMRHPERVKAIAFVEAYLKEPEHEAISLPVQEFMARLQAADGGYDAVVNQNFLVEQGLVAMTLCKLSETVLANYRQSFLTPASRKPLWQFVQDLPSVSVSSEAKTVIARYSQHLQQSSVPKLMMYAWPGFMTTIETVEWAKKHLSNTTFTDLGEALHFPQETNPQGVSEALIAWYQTIR